MEEVRHSLNWIEMIRRSGLTFVRKHRMRDEVVVYESLHRWQGVVIGKYLIIPMSCEKLLEISESDDHFKQFEDETIAPYFFKLKGDWGWNLYICFVLTDANVSRIQAERVSRIQRGKRFGKKLMITADQLIDQLPMAKIPERFGGKAAANPLYEWQEVLAPEGLSFCLDDFRQQSIREYLEGNIGVERPSFDTAEEPSPVERPVGPIRSLHIGKQFRPHCLADVPPLEFSQVNLLEGPNGMGKTSILECIELAYTGVIQRNMLADRTATELWDGRLLLGDGEFTEIPSEEERKRRERAYYKRKAAPRATSQLNSAFHQYNYFSSEAVHQFCFHTSKTMDYRSAFARVIFGEQLERRERCWDQYLQEFRRTAKRLKEEKDELSKELSSSEHIGNKDSELLKLRVRDALQMMALWMKRCYLIYPLVEKNAELHEIEAWHRQLKPLLQAIDVIRPSLANGEAAGVETYGQWTREQKAVRSAREAVEAQLAEMQGQLNELPPIDQLEAGALELLKRVEQLNDQQESLEKLYQQANSFADLIDRKHAVEQRLELEERLDVVSNDHRLLQEVWKLYGHLSQSELPKQTVDQLYDAILALEERRDALLSKEENIKQHIQTLHERASKWQAILSAMKASAFQVLHEHPQQSNCPLCGHDHETNELLHHAIDSSLRDDDEELTKQLFEEERIVAERTAIEREMQKLKQDVLAAEQAERARVELSRRTDIIHRLEVFDFSGDEGLEGTLDDGEVVQEVLRRAGARLIQLEALRDELHRQVEAFDKEGLDLHAIRRFRAFMEEVHSTRLATSFASDVQSGKAWVEQIAKRRKENEALLEAAKTEYMAVRQDVEQNEQARLHLRTRIEQAEEQKRKWVRREKQLDKLKRAFARLKEHNVHMPDHHAWSEWRQSFDKLNMASEELSQSLAPRILEEHKANEISALHIRFEEVKSRLERCVRAVRVLKSLRRLAKYGDDFVHQNFAAISQLFVALHAPNEFERLEWTDDNKIVALRKGSDTSCALHQMSTGQRTAVILSVFFIMHLVMESAPQFMLLDEPVAHMDDLNIVGLLDFLRQLTISRGTQLFFTTANPHVATLFRRKFSMLEDRFRSFHLRRAIEGPARIHIQQYRPYQDQAIILTAVH